MALARCQVDDVTRDEMMRLTVKVEDHFAGHDGDDDNLGGGVFVKGLVGVVGKGDGPDKVIVDQNAVAYGVGGEGKISMDTGAHERLSDEGCGHGVPFWVTDG